MKRLKLASIFLVLIFVASCSLGKKYLSPKGPDSTAPEQNIRQNESPQKSWESDSESYLRAGIQKLQNQAYEAAIQEFKKALILDPHRADAYYYLALAEHKSGHLDDAVEGYRAALKANPELYEAIFNLAVIYSLQRKHDLALEQYYQGLNIFPDDPELHYNMGLCLDQMGKTDKAALEYQKACQLGPRMTDAYLQLAGLYERQGKVPEAIAEYQKALKISPGNEVAQKNLAVLSSRESEGEKTAQAQPAAGEPEDSQPQEGSMFSKLMFYPQKLYRSIRGDGRGKDDKGADEERLNMPQEAGHPGIKKSFNLGINNKLVTQKKVVFTNNVGDNTMKSKRTIAQLGYTPGLLKNTCLYLNLGSISMGFDQALDLNPQVKFEKAVAFAYGAGISSHVYNVPESPLGIKVNLDLLHYSPKGNDNEADTSLSAAAEVTEYQLAADTVYQGFRKFSPYLGLLYAKSSGSLDFSDSTGDISFDEKDQFGFRIGTGYDWRENIKLTAECRLLDESALSLLINYAF
ncbi:MAG: tetratricopeptide repeat protein [bacterium]